jgi:uncharacterized membrane protein
VTSTGALAGRLRHTGIDETFLREMRSRLVPGTSALMVLGQDADLDVVRPALERGRGPGDVTVMHAWLRADAPQMLRNAMGEASCSPARRRAVGMAARAGQVARIG